MGWLTVRLLYTYVYIYTYIKYMYIERERVISCIGNSHGPSTGKPARKQQVQENDKSSGEVVVKGEGLPQKTLSPCQPFHYLYLVSSHRVPQIGLFQYLYLYLYIYIYIYLYKYISISLYIYIIYTYLYLYIYI